VLVVALALALLAPAAASAQSRSSSDIQRELEEARQQTASLTSRLGDVRSQIGSTEQQLAEIAIRLEDARARLRQAEGQVALAEVALREAERERDVAIAAHERAVVRLEETETELAFEEERLADQLIGTFKYGTSGAQRGAMFLEVLRRSSDPNDYAVAMKQMRVVIDVQESTVQRVFDLREQQAARTAEAETARAQAAQAAADAQATLTVVEGLRAEAQAVADEIAADEAAQKQILDGLQGTAAETSALLQRAASREQELRQQLAAAIARETGTSDRSGFPGWAGGPDISGAVCPVQGARAGRDFTNDWGYPRWPNRWHQGNDIFASRGTAVVAVADGRVVRLNAPGSQSSLGGITVTYRTADGSEWYNAHLDGISSGISVGANVSRGQQIGVVGNTGNARSTPPHLHLGRLYGGSWVNPWPTVSGWC
jgi:murein DD-endopeptidase MepM/ murein hydrolase activator NlpD